MTASNQSRQPKGSVLGTLQPLLPVVIPMLLALVGLLYFDRLPLLLAVAVVGGAGWAMLRWPDLTTSVAIGLVYTNLAVVAVRFHGAPAVLPAAVLAMLAWPFAYRLLVRREKLLLLSASPFILLLVVVQLAGALLASEPRMAIQNFMAFLLEGVAVYILVTNVVRTRRVVLATFWILTGCGLLMGGVPLLQQLTGTFDSSYGGLAQTDSHFQAEEDAVAGPVRQARTAGTIGEQNRYAQFMLILVPIGIATYSLSTTASQKALALTAVFAAFGGFALAFSRGAAVGLALSLLIAFGFQLLNRRQVGLLLAGAICVVLLFPQYLTRIASLGSAIQVVGDRSAMGQTDGSVRGRLTEMGSALLAFRDHPLVGVGPGMFARHSKSYGQIIGLRSLDDNRQSHSLPLDIAAEHGLLGLVAMAGLLGIVLWRLLQARAAALDRGDQYAVQLATGVFLALVIYLTTGLFLHLSYIRYFWLLLGLADATGHVLLNGDRGGSYLPEFGLSSK